MTIKRTFAITTILASIVMMAISGTTQSANAQLFGSNAIPNDADALLVEIIDGSGSISDSDFQLQLDGLVAGLQATYDALAGNPQLDLFGESYIVVIQVSSPDVVTDGAVTECTMEVDNQGDLDTLKTCIGDITQITNAQGVKGDTCTSCGFNLAVVELANAPAEFTADDDVQIIDLITDGNPFPELNQVALDAEDAAIAAGYDRVVAIGISDGVDSAFLALIVDPNPPGAINPVPLPEDDGFVITVDDFTEFAPALERKLIGTIIVCPPGTFLPPGGIPPDDCLPDVVGGEFLPVDTTALLIAGMSANMSLIVPIAAGIAGAGAYLIRSRMSKD